MPETQPGQDQDKYVAQQTSQIIDGLLKKYRPRLSITAFSLETGLVGNIDFYDNYELVETYSIKELHAFGVSVIKKVYGADLIHAGKSFVVSSWGMPVQSSSVVQSVPAKSDDGLVALQGQGG